MTSRNCARCEPRGPGTFRFRHDLPGSGSTRTSRRGSAARTSIRCWPTRRVSPGMAVAPVRTWRAGCRSSTGSRAAPSRSLVLARMTTLRPRIRRRRRSVSNGPGRALVTRRTVPPPALDQTRAPPPMERPLAVAGEAPGPAGHRTTAAATAAMAWRRRLVAGVASAAGFGETPGRGVAVGAAPPELESRLPSGGRLPGWGVAVVAAPPELDLPPPPRRPPAPRGWRVQGPFPCLRAVRPPLLPGEWRRVCRRGCRSRWAQASGSESPGTGLRACVKLWSVVGAAKFLHSVH